MRFGILVGVRGFEPPASWSRTKHSTKLSHTPKKYLICYQFPESLFIIHHFFCIVNSFFEIFLTNLDFPHKKRIDFLLLKKSIICGIL